MEVTALDVPRERVRIELSYNGSGFHGWAKQDGLRTVQGEIEAALETVFRRPISLTVAGRTDAGVHAAHQVAHADLPVPVEPHALEKLCDRLNGLIASRYGQSWREAVQSGAPAATPDKGLSDLVIYRIEPVSDEFDARFSALARHYEYRLVDSKRDRSPISSGDAWWCPYEDLDVSAMQQAADRLVGLHDFLSFCKPREGATTVRELTELKVGRAEDGGLLIRVSADAFCHSMVRSLVGALVEVGRGKRDLTWVEDLVRNPGRNQGVPIAPARGLTLVQVDYPPEEQWGQRASQARSVRDASEICCGGD